MLGVSLLFPLRVLSADTCLQPWGLDSASPQLSSQSALGAASFLNNFSYQEDTNSFVTSCPTGSLLLLVEPQMERLG